MNDREYGRTVERLKREHDHWSLDLWLREWNIVSDFVRSGFEGDEDPPPAGFVRQATAVADWRYKKATLKFNVAALVDLPRGRVGNVVLHEMLHVIVNEMREWAEGNAADHEERVVTHLENVIGMLVRQRDEARAELRKLKRERPMPVIKRGGKTVHLPYPKSRPKKKRIRKQKMGGRGKNKK